MLSRLTRQNEVFLWDHDYHLVPYEHDYEQALKQKALYNFINIMRGAKAEGDRGLLNLLILVVVTHVYM